MVNPSAILKCGSENLGSTDDESALDRSLLQVPTAGDNEQPGTSSCEGTSLTIFKLCWVWVRHLQFAG